MSNVEHEVKTPSISDEAILLVDRLFKFLQIQLSYFRYLHAQNQGELLQTKREWVKTFQARGISEEHIRRAVNKIRQLQEPLKDITPVEFIRLGNLCAGDLNIPVVEVAYREAVSNYGVNRDSPVWSHEVVHHAAYYTGRYELMTNPRRESYALFKRNYDIAIQMALKGDLKPIPKAISHDDIAEHTKREIIVNKAFKDVRSVSEMLAALNMKSTLAA